MLKDFKAFVSKGNVIDMAVGVIVGGAFGKIVTSFVNDIVMPLLGLLTGGIEFSKLSVVLRPEELDAAGAIVREQLVLNYGLFIQNIVDFFLIALSIFLALRVIFRRRDKRLKAEALAKQKEEEAKGKEPTELDVLTQIRDLLAKEQKI